MSSNSSRNDFSGWEVLRDAPAEQVALFPPPATGRFVIALDPPALDGVAMLRGEHRNVPRREHLALLWENRRGEQVLYPTDGFLLGNGREAATWLPKGWEMDVFPTGWTQGQLECWFDYALKISSIENRSDIPPGSDTSPPYAPAPRGLVAHAHMILRHLGLQNSPQEPRGPMDRAGCIAELRDVLGFLQRTFEPQPQNPPRPDGPEPPRYLWLKGIKHQIGRPRSQLSWRLLSFFWDREAADYEDLQGQGMPWPDPVSDGAIATAINRFNSEVPAQLPWRLRTANRRVYKHFRENPAA
jgi:hypothetical protein